MGNWHGLAWDKRQELASRLATCGGNGSGIARRVGIAIVASLMLAGCTGRDDRFSLHLSKGLDFFEREDFDKAGVEFRNALQVNPRKAQIHYWIGRHAEATRQWQQAFGAYLKGLEHEPDHVDSKVRLARLYLMVGDLARAEKRIVEIRVARPDDPNGAALQASLLAARGDLAKAVGEAVRILEQAPGHAEATAIVTEQLIRSNEVQKARGVLEREIASNPRSIELRQLYGNLLASLEENRRLEENLKLIVELAPKRFEGRAALSAFYLRTSRADQAEQVLRDAIDADKDDDRRFLALVDFKAARSGFGPAVAELKKGIADRPRSHALKAKLGQLHEAAGLMNEANTVFREVMQGDKSGAIGAQARVHLAWNLFDSGEVVEATTLIDELLKANPRDTRGLVSRAHFAMARRDYSTAIADLLAVSRFQPGSPSVVALLAVAYRAGGQENAGLAAIRDAVEQYPHVGELRLLLADYLFQRGDRAAALRELDVLIAREPRNARAYEAKAVLQRGTQDWAGVGRTYAALKSAFPESPLGPFRLAQLHIKQKLIDSALPELDLAMARSIRSKALSLELISLYAQLGRLERAAASANNLARADPRNPFPWIALSHIQMAQKRYSDAEASLDRAGERDRSSPAVHIAASRLHALKGDLARSLAVLVEARSGMPHDPALALALAEAYQQSGADGRAVEYYEMLLVRMPENENVANNLAYLLASKSADKSELDRALKLAKRFVASGNPSYLDTLGWVHVKRGEFQLAIPVLRRAVDRAPGVPTPMYHLAVALISAGQLDEGRALLRKAIDSNEAFGAREEAKRLLAHG